MGAHDHGRFASLGEEEVYPGVRRRTFSSEQATVNRYEFDAGGTFPIHRHPNEQITLVEHGSVAFTVAGETAELGAGSWSVVAPDVEHGITAGPEGARILAIVVPRRDRSDDYEVVQA
jgi:quercetin dioxygenase-like cupin family protein